MKKVLKITLKVFLILIITIIVIFAGALAYVSLNKKKIIAQVTTAIGEKINGHIAIEDIDLSFLRTFPHISVLLKNVSVTDTMIDKHRHPLFSGEEVFVSFSIYKLINKEPPLNGIRLQKATIFLFTDTSGYTNTYILKPKRDSAAATAASSTAKNELKLITLKDVNIILQDDRKEKLYNFQVNRLALGLEDKDSTSFLFAVKTDILVKSLAFNLPRGSFLQEKTFTGKFDMAYNKPLGQLQFDSIDIELAGQPFNLSGRFDLKGPSPQFALRLNTEQIGYDFVKTLIPARIAANLNRVHADKPIDATADIKGPLKGGEPKVYITWKTKHAHVKTPFLDFDNASFEGYYINEVVAGLPRKDPNSKIHITSFTADWHDFKLTSNSFEILNLYQPVLTCDLGSRFKLSALNDVTGSESILFKEGTGSIQIMYKGPIERNNNTNSFINGAVSFKDALILYAPRNVELSSVNGKMTFRNSDLFVENLQCMVLKNKIMMQGEARNLLTLINTQPGKASISWKISTPSLNLGAFTYLLKNRKNVTAAAGNKRSVADMATKIDNLMEQCKLQVTLNAGELLYKNFTASNTVADITLLQDRYLINKVSMDHAGGHLDLNGSLVNLRTNYHEARLKASVDHVDVSRIFKAFENFGQDGITSESLAGKLTARVNASMGIDDEGKPIASSIVSLVDFSLKDGALNHYEPLKKLQRFVFKKRDFDNIRFAEIKNRLEIRNQEVKINRMEIQSTVLSLFVEGIFSQTGRTDMSIQVPLSNLKKRDEDYNPENIGTHTKAGGSIFVRGRPGTDGNIKFKLDLFNKYNKEKEKAVIADSLQKGSLEQGLIKVDSLKQDALPR